MFCLSVHPQGCSVCPSVPREVLSVAAALCGPELERFGRCVAASAGSWARDCHQLSLSVTRCTSHHPLVRRIRRDCSDSFGAFERCLRDQPRDAAACGSQLQEFLSCAQSVTREHSQNSSPDPGRNSRATENPWN
ncbi:coiled-coil-helix-coiled-coil-helix domain-containing protein 5 isoform X3 [Poecile atricapillus]|uniref:coiled-coil-helix-coiled-coil-helix domain-containing protein 5 isoform X3 n=1 Tax=Poecile atricapillus TaxID=48891 RepID=UPI0027390195|nr:coiled-coil-helix-coiled-coil-helix domain-containing protein 5 isoform X3 [Poecile atricapillus]